jgi:hypothetical protein
MVRKSRLLLIPALLVLIGCGGPGEVDEEQAANLAAEFEAGADNANDETEAQVLREQAESLRERSQGNEAAGDVKVTGE